MKKLKDYGLISNFWDYEDLPIEVLEHARVLMHAEADVAGQMRHG